MNILHGIIVAARHFIKNKFSSLINVTGLAIGLTGFICIMLYVEHEFSFDKFHSRYGDTYRVVTDFVSPDGSRVPDATTPPALSKALRTDLSEVETATRITQPWGRLYLVQYEDQKFYETKMLRVDQEFFNVFDFEFIEGNHENALKKIHSIILTESTAKKYFGDNDALGKTLRMNVNGGTDYEVSGILADIPANSHFSFDLLIPFESRRDVDTDWQGSGFYTYVRLKKGANASLFPVSVQAFVKKHLPNTLNEYHVQALADIHLKSNLKWELSANGNITYVKILMLIGMFVLLIACINYVNLITAQSSKRAKEVGIRKSIGAQRIQLVRQFLTESMLTVSVSLVVCFFIASFILPSMKSVTGVDLSGFLFDSQVFRWSFPFALLLAFVSGFYPAIYLSGFQPVKTLKGNFVTNLKGGGVRKSLVVVQFAMSSALIAGMLIVISQLDFMKNKDMGFNKENVVLVPNVRGGIGGQGPSTGSWDEEIRQLSGVSNVARADGILGLNNATNGIGEASTNSHISLNFIRIDYDFIPTMAIEMEQGRNFSPDFISDETAIIINEEAVRQLRLQEPIIGQKLAWDDAAGITHDVTVVGVARDFHFTNLHTAITPFGFMLEVDNGSNFFIRINSGDLQGTLGQIGNVWSKYNPGRPFMYTFQDEYIARLTINDERFETLFSAFTVLGIIIACLGLFGLTVFLAESRTKEIGLRRIMGASVVSILKLMSRESIGLIILSMLIAFPATYYLMTTWLEGFAYHVSIGWQVFIIAGIASMAMGFLTISFHALKVAMKNPVESLRTE